MTTDALRAAIIAALKRRDPNANLWQYPTESDRALWTAVCRRVEVAAKGYGAGADLDALRALAVACGLREAPCPACDGRGRRAYGREVEDGCDECECAGVVVVDPEEERERLTRERDESIALERERCAALVREIPACQPGAKATAARRWLDDRVAACVRAIVVDDETATCARASVRDAMERAKVAEADAARVSEAYAIDLAGLRDTLRRVDDLRVMWRERVADVASERDALRAELDATRAALRANLRCDECDDLATRVHADTARFGCESHGVGEGWSDTTHAAVVREALR